MSGKVPSRAAMGFTLIELLVVMSLLSLLMTGLVAAMRTMAQTESRIDKRLGQLDEVRSVRAFLQQTLLRVSAARLDALGATGASVVPFLATENSLRWVGVLPARPNVGGKHFFRLALEPVGSKDALVLRFAPCRADMSYPDWSHTESRIILDGVDQFRVEAQGLPPQGHARAGSWPQGWQMGWPVPDALPEQVRLSFADTSGSWPQWVFPLHALPRSDGTMSVTVIGGSRR